MFEIVRSNDTLNKVLSYIGEDYFNCPYLYANLKRYGVDDDKINVYIDNNEKSELSCVALMYYDCLHLYYDKSFSVVCNIRELIEKLKPRTIFSPSYEERMNPDYSGYHGKVVLVMSPKCFLDIDTSKVKNATIKDISRIAEFMYTFWDDIYESPKIISQQMKERMLDNYGRTKFIEDSGEIVACVSSYAELDNFAINSGLLVADSQRGKKIGSVMLKSIYEELENEGKKTCGIIVDDYSRIFHEKNGFEVVGKLMKYSCNV